MKLLYQDCDVQHEAAVPLVRALLSLTESLDQLQQRMLTFHSRSPNPRAVCSSPVRGRRPAAPEGRTNL